MKFIVIFLGILILLSFIGIIYGSYIKLSSKNEYDFKKYKIILESPLEKIESFKVIDEDMIIFKIEKYQKLEGEITSFRFVIYDIKKNPLTWLDTMLNGVEHMNFFEGRATEYSKASTKGSWAEAFS